MSTLHSQVCYAGNYFLSAIINGVVPLVLVILASGAIAYACRSFFDPKLRNRAPHLIAGFASLGGAIGLFTGSSRSPVVAAMLPAFITFLTALVTYALDSSRGRLLRPLIPALMLATVLSSVFTSYYASSARNVREEWERELELYSAQFKEQQIAVVKKFFEKTIDSGEFDEQLMLSIFGGPPSNLPAPRLIAIDCPRPEFSTFEPVPDQPVEEADPPSRSP